MSRLDNDLREAFEARAAQVEVSPDALVSIRGRLSRRSRRRRRVVIGLASAATAAAAGLAAILLVIGPNAAPIIAPTAPVGASPTAPEQPPPSTPSAPPAGVALTVPVYFSATVDGRVVLYREFRSVRVPEDSLVDRTVGALGLSLRGDALDPDYGTRWSSGRITHVAEGQTEVVVEISDAPPSVVDDPMAVQQLVWTVTAVAADMGRTAKPVRLSVNGLPVGVFTRAPANETLAYVWLVSPQQGDTVGQSFTVRIVGSVWEATARLRVRDDAGDPIYDEMVMLDVGAPAQGQAEVPMMLPPGRYTVEAYFVSAREDIGELSVDSHDITIA